MLSGAQVVLRACPPRLTYAFVFTQNFFFARMVPSLTKHVCILELKSYFHKSLFPLHFFKPSSDATLGPRLSLIRGLLEGIGAASKIMYKNNNLQRAAPYALAGGFHL